GGRPREFVLAELAVAVLVGGLEAESGVGRVAQGGADPGAEGAEFVALELAVLVRVAPLHEAIERGAAVLGDLIPLDGRVAVGIEPDEDIEDVETGRRLGFGLRLESSLGLRLLVLRLRSRLLGQCGTDDSERQAQDDRQTSPHDRRFLRSAGVWESVPTSQ